MKTNYPSTPPFKITTEEVIKEQVEKLREKRRAEMRRLKDEYDFPLRIIGGWYKISRQRVGKILSDGRE
jgi:DNA-directed RNA polymerase sigma subunit (sigma70/sigma32)